MTEEKKAERTKEPEDKEPEGSEWGYRRTEPEAKHEEPAPSAGPLWNGKPYPPGDVPA